MPLWIRTSVSVLERATDMSVPANNMAAEGMINNEKNLVSNMRAKTSEPGTYWWYFYLTLLRASKYMITEMERCEGYMDKRRELIKKKALQNERAEKKSKEKTEDSREMDEENNTDMVWDRKGNMEWLNEEESVRKDVILTLQFMGIWEDSLIRQHNAIDRHGGKGGNGKSMFMSRPTFNKWIARKPTRKLDEGMISIMQSWVKTNGDTEGESK